MAVTKVDERLLEWATPRQAEMIEAVNRLGSPKYAAIELGIKSSANITDAIRELKAKAARDGYAPGHWKDGVAAGYRMGKVTVQRGPEGVERTWERQHPDDERRALIMRAAAEALAEELPRVSPTPAPDILGENKLCNLFTITDAHVGMLAWRKEGGEDWDLRIAEDTLVNAFAHMIRHAPRARIGVVNQLGDFLHFDGLKAVTPAHGHLLDADGRFRKITQVAIRVFRRMIDMALETHESVHVICAEGNHDESSSGWLSVMMQAIYENEPRVAVDDSALPYYAYQHGKTMLGFHHGHLKKNSGLPLHFAASYPKMWGATTKRYIHVGHRHHVEEKEHSGIKVVQHSTLAARDAYAARGGWMTERQAIVITYHEEHGEVARATVTPEMLG